MRKGKVLNGKVLVKGGRKDHLCVLKDWGLGGGGGKEWSLGF